MSASMNRRDLARLATLASLAHVLPSQALWSAAVDNASTEEALPLFLRDNFAPVSEELDAENLEIVGSIPSELRGMYVRNGPNPMFKPRGTYHWFDGDGMLHGVHLMDGNASYRNRYVRTRGLDAEKRAGKAVYGGLLDPPTPQDLLRGPQDMFKNAANTALAWHAGKLLALWEAGPPHEIELPSLQTKGLHHFNGKLRHNFTAHPKIDPQTGEMRFFGYGIMGSMVGYGVVDAKGQVVHSTTFRCRYPAMMHDFAVTENHSLFLELPCAIGINPGKGLFSWRPELGARIGVLPRHGHGKEIQWFDASTCFVFHTLNAFEHGDEIHLYACRTDEFPPVIGPKGATRQAQWTPDWVGSPRLSRWRINLKAGTVVDEVVHDMPAEFPRINDGLLGRPTRYGYAMSIDLTSHVKWDLKTGRHVLHEHGRNRFAGEAIFIPRTSNSPEDDGWMMSYVFDQDRGKSELVVWDAAAFDSPPVARVLLPTRIPYGFHGAWISEESMRSGAA